VPRLLALSIALFSAGVSSATEDPVVVASNDETDLAFEIMLSEVLVIGAEDGSESPVLGRVFGIAVDSQDDIYVLDNGFQRIQRYNKEGILKQTIGHAGEGPGEFEYPTAIDVDVRDEVHVADRGKIVVFDSDGNLKREIHHELAGVGLIRAIAISDEGDTYVSCTDIFEQKVIHRLSDTGKVTLSFCDTYGVGQEVDARVEATYAGGYIDLDSSGAVYYTQMTPYEIRRFTPQGQLQLRSTRETAFAPPPEVRRAGEGMAFGPLTGSFSVVVVNDDQILNTLKKPASETQPSETVIDLFDAQGRILASKRLRKDLTVRCADASGHVYGFDQTEVPRIVKYRLEIAKRLEGKR
jgi:hypothetical protein